MSKKKSNDPAPEADAADGEGAPEGGKKKLPLKLILIGAGALVIVLGGGGGAAFFLLKPAPGAEAKKPEAKKEAKKDEKKDEKGKKGSGSAMGEVRAGPDGVSFYTMPDLVVNMQVPDGRPTFLKLKLTFEISDPATVDEVQEDLPRIQDMFTAFLRELRPDDLAGSQGAYELKAEILRRVNLVLAPRKVDSVLIEEMLVQ